MKNIIFDLGGVVFSRDRKKCGREFTDFFSFLALSEIPSFWNEYDRGTLSMEQVKESLCQYHNCSRATVELHMHTAIAMQEEIMPTKILIEELKHNGYKLYILSNMSAEFIEHLRKFSVYTLFDGDVISCEEYTTKPERKIYEILLSRYKIDPLDSIFVDDRQANLDSAAEFGIDTFLFERNNPEHSCNLLRQMLLDTKKL